MQFVESMNGIRAVQAYRREERNDADHGRPRRRPTATPTPRRSARVAWYVGALRGGRQPHAGGGARASAALRVADGALELGALTAFLLYLRRFYDPLDELAQFFNSYQSAAAALEKIATVLDTAPGVPEPAAPVRAAVAGARGAGVRPRCGSPTGGPAERIVLPEFVAARARPGRRWRWSARPAPASRRWPSWPRGSTTRPTGAVRLDGIDLRDVADAELRRALVMITQEAFLFSGSVADNIALGRPDAIPRRGRRGRRRPSGRGSSSRRCPTGSTPTCASAAGGCRRASGSWCRWRGWCWPTRRWCCWTRPRRRWTCRRERAVQAALETVLADRTALIIAHRLSTVLIADRVLVLADGRIVQDGSPAELLADGGEFAELHAAWRASLASST